MSERRAGPAVAGVVAALAAWSWATMLSNVPIAGYDRVRALDPTGLVVDDWRFFAPRPAVHDAHVVYRVAGADGVPGPWRDLPVDAAPRAWWHVLVNPHKRRYKQVFDVTAAIVNVDGADLSTMRRNPGHRMLLARVRHVARRHDPDAVAVQFAVVRSTGHDDGGRPQYLFASAAHRLAP